MQKLICRVIGHKPIFNDDSFELCDRCLSSEKRDPYEWTNTWSLPDTFKSIIFIMFYKMGFNTTFLWRLCRNAHNRKQTKNIGDLL